MGANARAPRAPPPRARVGASRRAAPICSVRPAASLSLARAPRAAAHHPSGVMEETTASAMPREVYGFAGFVGSAAAFALWAAFAYWPLLELLAGALLGAGAWAGLARCRGGDGGSGGGAKLVRIYGGAALKHVPGAAEAPASRACLGRSVFLGASGRWQRWRARPQGCRVVGAWRVPPLRPPVCRCPLPPSPPHCHGRLVWT